MRLITMLPLVVLVACSPTPGAMAPSPEPDVRLSTPQGSHVISTGGTVIRGVANIEAGIDRVWDGMRVAYDSLAIPLTVFDASTHTIGNEGLKARRRIGKSRISEYLNCGNGEGGPSADMYDVNLSVVTRLTTNADAGTTVTTTVDAVAKPANFSGENIRCGTTGELEKRLVKITEGQLR
jgi:hypothetical protein